MDDYLSVVQHEVYVGRHHRAFVRHLRRKRRRCGRVERLYRHALTHDRAYVTQNTGKVWLVRLNERPLQRQVVDVILNVRGDVLNVRGNVLNVRENILNVSLCRENVHAYRNVA